MKEWEPWKIKAGKWIPGKYRQSLKIKGFEYGLLPRAENNSIYNQSVQMQGFCPQVGQAPGYFLRNASSRSTP